MDTSFKEEGLIISNESGVHLLVNIWTWRHIVEAQEGRYKFSEYFQFNGIIPGVVDEDGEIAYIRSVACDMKKYPTLRGGAWSLTSLKPI